MAGRLRREYKDYMYFVAVNGATFACNLLK